MTGYRRKLYTLKWPEGHDLHGLEVTTKGLSVEKLLEIVRLASAWRAESAIGEKAAAAGKLFAEFARRLVAWNLEEDDGTPVPATLDGVADQDASLMIDVVMAWIDSVASVSGPKEPGLSSGGTSAPSPAMESLLAASSSPSPGS